MTFKSPQSSVEFQTCHDRDDDFEYVCYDCNLVTRNLVEDPYANGHARIVNVLEAMDHLRLHVSVGDMVPNDLIQSFRDVLEHRSLVHQSLMSPSRRCDGSYSGKREAAFFEQWLHEQEDHGSQPMFRALLNSWGIERWTAREVAIMASLIQWLGTNVGFCFLENALKRCGYKIVKDKSDG